VKAAHFYLSAALWPCVFAVLGFVLYAPNAAAALTCDHTSTSQPEQARCQWQVEAETDGRMDLALARALQAADLLERERHVPLAPQIRNAQLLWSAWAQAQCALEAEANPGPTASVVEPTCRQRLNKIREQALNRLADELTQPTQASR
jgi:hypothetical protein